MKRKRMEKPVRKQLVMYRDEDDIQMEFTGLGFQELATMCGVMQVLIGEMALEGGTDIEAVKSSLLDIHLIAMRNMEKNHLSKTEGG